MKKLINCLLLPLMVSSSVMAGKNVVPTDVKVIEIPQEVVVEVDKPGPLYVRGMGSFVKGDDVARTGSYDMGAVSVAFGYNMFSFFGIEARAAKSIKDNATAGDYSFSNVALYAKPQVTFMERVTLYGLVGYGQTEVQSDKDEMLQWGGGVEYMINDTWGLCADYTRVYDDTTFDTTTTNDSTNLFSVGVVVKL